MNRGYNEVRLKLQKAKNYLASCQLCKFYEEDEHGEGNCLNEKVTDYDVTIDGDRTFCSYWKPYQEPIKPEGKKKKR